MGDTRSPLEYLVICSKNALESMELARLNQASNLRKELRQVLEEWIETEVDARLARRILEYRRAQTCSANSRTSEVPKPVPLEQLAMSFLSPPCEPTSPTENGEHPATLDRGELADSVRPSVSTPSLTHTCRSVDETSPMGSREAAVERFAGNRDDALASAKPSEYHPALRIQFVDAELQALEHVARSHARRLSCSSASADD